MAEVEVLPLYAFEYQDDGMSLRFAELAYGRYLSMGMDLLCMLVGSPASYRVFRRI